MKWRLKEKLTESIKGWFLEEKKYINQIGRTPNKLGKKKKKKEREE